MTTYFERLVYALGHITVPIPSPAGWYHWYTFLLGHFILSVFGIGFFLGYMTKFIGRRKKRGCC